MAGLVLPVAAAAFWAGVVLSGWVPRRAAPLALVAGAVAVWGAARRRAGRRARSAGLLAAAGVAPGEPDGPRERILRAAGIGGHPLPAVPRPGRAKGLVLTGPPSRWTASRSPPGRLVLLALGVVWLGAGWGAVRAPQGDALLGIDGRRVAFSGVAASDVRTFASGWSVEVSAEGLEVADAALEGRLRLWLRGRGPAPRIEAGQPVAGSGRLSALGGGGGGFEAFLRSRGVVAMVAGDARAVGPPANPALRLANALRGALRTGVEALPPREGGLLLGLSIGDLSRMHPEVEEDFRATGLGHLVAVSGSNVAMFLAPLLAVAVALRAGASARLMVGLLGVGLFALVTRWEPSVLRASVMAGMALAGAFLGRPRSTSAVLGAAVLVLLAADPGLGRSVGFQLSVAATAGIAFLAGPLAGRLSPLPRPVAVAAAATLGAQAGVTPLLLLHFGVVPTVTLLANLLALPAVPAALLLGLLAAAAALLWLPAGTALGAVAALPLGYLVEVADRLARAPLPSLTGAGPAPPLVAATAVAVAAWRLRRGRRPVGTLVVLIAAASLLWGAGAGAGPPGRLTVTFLDVGQGDAAVVRSPAGATLLVDAGPEEQQVAVALARLGVRRLDLVVATHAHADHIEGFPAVFARFPVALLLEPGCPHDSPSYARFLEALSDERVRVHHPRGGETFLVGDVLVEVLGPDECSPDEPNDDSVVVRVSQGGAAVLFPGDAERPAQQDLLDDGDPVTAAVLKVPHHGGDTSLEPFFLAVGADVAVVSVGDNEYGHPVPSVLEALRRTGAVVLRTDLEGDVTVAVGPEGLLVQSAR